MKKTITTVLICIIFSTMAFHALSVPSGYVDSGRFPDNYLIQDMEPAMDEQWALDAVKGDDGSLYAVWADDRTGNSEIFFSSSENGEDWGDGIQNNNDVRVNDDAGEGYMHDHPSITIDKNGKLYCAWEDMRSGNPEIRVSSSVSSGKSWRDSRAPIDHDGTPSNPYIRWSNNGALGLVWAEENDEGDRDILFSRSLDGGFNFSDPVKINDDTESSDQINPRMAASTKGHFAIVWEDFRNGQSDLGENPDVYMAYSSNGGKDFSANIRVGPDPDEEKQQNPDLAFSDSGDLIITWEVYTSSGWKVMYAPAWTGSPSWDEEITQTYPGVRGTLERRDQTFPRVAFIGDAFALAWSELDIRNFHLIRCGYLSRFGDYFTQDHIVDDSIDWGNMSEELDTYYAEMERETSVLVGLDGRAQVFWIDYRTDPQPTNEIPEDGDPYTARSNVSVNLPKKPTTLRLSLKSYSWGSVTLKWDISPDVMFRSYYLTHGEGTAPLPDPYMPEVRIDHRATNTHTFEGLKPSTRYQFRLMVRDQYNSLAYSEPINVTTGRNVPPSFVFLEPDGISDTADRQYTIRWQVSDPEENANFTLYYDMDQEPQGQVKLYSGNSDDNNGYGELLWNTSDLEEGGYTINASVDDGVNNPVSFYSPAIIVDHPETNIDFMNVLSARVEGGVQSAWVDGSIFITLSSEPDMDTVNRDSVYLLDSDPNTNKEEGTAILNEDAELVWSPDNDLKYGEHYTLIMKPTIKDVDGNFLDGEMRGAPSFYRFSFRTMTDTEAPDIIEWSPDGDEVDPWTSLYLKFDIPINPESVTDESIKLESTNGSQVALDIYLSTSSSRIIKADVLQPLEPRTTHLVSLSPLIESDKGRRLGSGFNWTFTIGDPDMTEDRDDDGIPDDLDWFPDDPMEWEDSDRDGMGDVSDQDDDNDDMRDEWEERYGLDPKDPSDAEGDLDGDGITNRQEYLADTDPSGGDDDEEEFDILLAVLIILILAAAAMGVLALISFHRKRSMDTKREMDYFFKEE